MTFTLNVSGHDDLSGNEKAELENELVDEARALVDSFGRKHGVNVTVATAVTNTTGSVNLLEKDDDGES